MIPNLTTPPMNNDERSLFLVKPKSSGRAARNSRPEQVWRVVKANPHLTSKELAQLIPDMTYGAVSSTLSKMESRGQVYQSSPQGRQKTFATTLDEFSETPELEMQDAQELAPSPQPTLPFIPTVQQETLPSQLDIDLLTVGQARKLYQQLQGVFG